MVFSRARCSAVQLLCVSCLGDLVSIQLQPDGKLLIIRFLKSLNSSSAPIPELAVAWNIKQDADYLCYTHVPSVARHAFQTISDSGASRSLQRRRPHPPPTPSLLSLTAERVLQPISALDARPLRPSLSFSA